MHFNRDAMNWSCLRQVFVLSLLCLPGIAVADEVSSGDTAWMLTATALVLFMTLPGLALFYAGLVLSLIHI